MPHLNKIVSPGTGGGGGGGAPWVEDEFSPAGGQVTFILSQAPSDSDSLMMIVNGIVYDDGVDYTVSGQTLTWLAAAFAMESGDKVLIRYV